MRVLIDECAPRELAKFISKHNHECQTVQEAGWSGKQNGELLTLAEPLFDAFITLDTNLKHQQNLSSRKIAIILLRARSNRLSELAPLFSACATALEAIRPADFVILGYGE